tara:strand:- start:2301 stop:2492 length:192 start_codon:yes stop_codon:yes gene_type:complete
MLNTKPNLNQSLFNKKSLFGITIVKNKNPIDRPNNKADGSFEILAPKKKKSIPNNIEKNAPNP